MEWNRALRYKNLNEWSEEEKKHLLLQIENSPWRLHYHIQPESGLLNDPNGFSFFNDEWHLFYQNYPMGPVHGLKCWYHLSSKDLIHWKGKGLAILPDTEYDSHGCYSGSAIPVEDRLFIMYTGNVRDKNWNRFSYQLGAWMDKKGRISKLKTPLIAKQPENYTDHFRDPQIIRYHNSYYALIGAQTKQKEGNILVYQSKDLKNWEFNGPLELPLKNLGYMIECPNIVWVDQKPVLIFCPQGLDQNILHYQNIYPNTYLIGDTFDPEKNRFESKYLLHNLDEGFDIYATQAFNAPDGRTLAVSWIGLPEIDYPTDQYGWAHCLSLIKELKIQDGHLYQFPVKETESLRGRKIELDGVLTEQTQLILNQNETAYELEIILKGNGEGKLQLASDGHQALNLIFNFADGTLVLDRSHAGIPFAQQYGTSRTVQIPKNTPLNLHIFMDASVVEIFLNHGHDVLTSRFFPSKKQTKIFLETNHHLAYKGNYWSLHSINK